MKIALLGFDFICPNKGCEALSYTFIAMIKELYPKEKLIIHNISYKKTLGLFPVLYPEIEFVNHAIFLKNPKYLLEIWKVFRNVDIVFDITYGDSFSDIYGRSWLIKTNLHKQIALMAKTKLILLPQTYGPFYHNLLKKWSLKIIKKSTCVFSRDYKSAAYLETEGLKEIKVVTDLAMMLPKDSGKYYVAHDKINIGINVSSLLWEGGFTGKNELGLSVNYREYNTRLIKYMLDKEIYEIHLIPHVIEDIPEARENDWRPLRQLKEMFPDTILAPEFTTPMEIKSYISNMDVFIGARMHATIAAFSSGIPVIPFSYSRKFEGLFGNLNYNYVINGRNLSTEEALETTTQYIQSIEEMKQAQMVSMKKVIKLLEQFKTDLKNEITLSIETCR